MKKTTITNKGNMIHSFANRILTYLDKGEKGVLITTFFDDKAINIIYKDSPYSQNASFVRKLNLHEGDICLFTISDPSEYKGKLYASSYNIRFTGVDYSKGPTIVLGKYQETLQTRNNTLVLKVYVGKLKKTDRTTTTINVFGDNVNEISKKVTKNQTIAFLADSINMKESNGKKHYAIIEKEYLLF